MSILSDAAEEAMKPIKVGVFIGATVLTLGALAMAANSGPGRTLLKKIKGSLTSKKVEKEQIEEKKDLESANAQHPAIPLKKEEVKLDDVKRIPLAKGSDNV